MTAVAATFSPGPHGATLTGIQVPDVARWVNKKLKLWQH